MKYKLLGQTGLQVSELCFGTMSFGGDASQEESAAMYKACRDRGINFFDCADAYSKGKAETILGKLMRSERDHLVVTSKCFNQMDDDMNTRGGNRRHILRAVEASLQRLNTDRLDVLFMHRWDNDVPLEETLRALEQLVADGKVLYLGASNWSAWQVSKALGIADKRGWPRIDVIQPMYNLVKRQSEVEIFPMALAENLGVITYSPVGGGVLSGKYGLKNRPNMGRIVDKKEYTDRYGEDWVFEVAEKFTAYAKKAGHHPVSLAVAWAAQHPAVTCPIIGARNMEQLEPSLNALDIGMDAKMHGEIAALSRTPPNATDRREEQLG
mgnify:CR=1 FL=1